MSGFDDEIDALYRLPPDAFTEARNQLAKRAGGEPGKAIRALARPALAAWPVNAGRLPRARQAVEEAVHERDRLKRRVDTPSS